MKMHTNDLISKFIMNGINSNKMFLSLSNHSSPLLLSYKKQYHTKNWNLILNRNGVFDNNSNGNVQCSCGSCASSSFGTLLRMYSTPNHNNNQNNQNNNQNFNNDQGDDGSKTKKNKYPSSVVPKHENISSPTHKQSTLESHHTTFERELLYRDKQANIRGKPEIKESNVTSTGPIPEGEVEHNIHIHHPQNLHKHYILSPKPNPNKERENPLTKIISRKIRAHGPMPISTFMKECLFHEEYGYYSTRENIFGRKGDFITSPEISSLFSEMIGFWIVSEWKNLGSPKEFRIIELGPGKGTLMKDALKTIESTKLWEKSNVKTTVILVEKSKNLREEQRKTLQLKQIFDTKTGEGKGCYSYANTSIKWVSSLDELIYSEDNELNKPDNNNNSSNNNNNISNNNTSMNNDNENIYFKGNDKSPLIVIAHEFFDALPVNQFKYTEKGWCEYMVDTAEDTQDSEHFRIVLSPGATPNCAFAKMRAGASPLWTYILKDKEKRLNRNLEVSNEAIAYMQQIGMILHENKGSALIFDYGYRNEIKDNNKVLTLQGIKDHKHVSPLSLPGEVDLSTFVDFYLLMYSVMQIPTIRAAKVLSQRDFLYRMGVDARLMKLMMSKSVSKEEINKIYSAFNRLTNPKDMGEIFKVLCISTLDLPTSFEDPRAFEQMEKNSK